jgi:hypothetical protein
VFLTGTDAGVKYGGDTVIPDALGSSDSSSEESAVGGVEGGLPWIELSVDDGCAVPSTSVVPSQKLPSRCRWRGDWGPNVISGGYEPGMAVRAFRNGSVSSCSGDGKASGAILTRAAAQRIAAAVVVRSASGTTGSAIGTGGGSIIGRAPVDDRISVKELRRRCGIDNEMFEVELRWDVDGARTSGEDPGVGGVGVDVAEEGVLLVRGGVSSFRREGDEASDEARGKEAPCEVLGDGVLCAVLASSDGEIVNIR